MIGMKVQLQTRIWPSRWLEERVTTGHPWWAKRPNMMRMAMAWGHQFNSRRTSSLASLRLKAFSEVLCDLQHSKGPEPNISHRIMVKTIRLSARMKEWKEGLRVSTNSCHVCEALVLVISYSKSIMSMIHRRITIMDQMRSWSSSNSKEHGVNILDQCFTLSGTLWSGPSPSVVPLRMSDLSSKTLTVAQQSRMMTDSSSL
jgi:hypothetical protein